MARKRTVRSELRRAVRWLLLRTWVLRADLRALDRRYRPLVANTKGDEREMLNAEWASETAELLDELEELQARRLLRRAWHYYIVALEKPHGDDDENEHWRRGFTGETWHLKPAGIASIRRQIEEARARRREACATWAKILGGLLTGLIALVSALVSLILATKR